MKKRLHRLALCSMLSCSVLAGGALTATTINLFVTDSASATQVAESQKVTGKVSNISQKAKTLALSLKDDSFFLLKFTDETKLVGAESTKDFRDGDAIIVTYHVVGGENIADSLEMDLVKLPAGISEIKTDELAKVMTSDKTVLIDARPAPKYAEFHIQGAVSLPYAKLAKMGEEGAKLLEPYKDKQLIFYCGGPT